MKMSCILKYNFNAFIYTAIIFHMDVEVLSLYHLMFPLQSMFHTVANFSLKFWFRHPISLGMKMATYSVFLSGKTPQDREDCWATAPNNQLLYPII